MRAEATGGGADEGRRAESTRNRADDAPPASPSGGCVMESIEHVGRSLLLLRIHRKLSQAELARRAGIRPNQLSRYELGQVLPMLRQLARLLDALGVDEVDFLLFHRQLRELDRTWELLEAAAGRDDHSGVLEILRQSLARSLRGQRELHRRLERMVVEVGDRAGTDRGTEGAG